MFFFRYFYYELQISYSNGNNFIASVFFNLMLNAFFSFLLKTYLWIDIILPISFLWISMIVTYLLSLDKYYSTSLEKKLLYFYYTNLTSLKIRIIFLIKILIHWIIYGFSTSLISFFISLFLYDVNFTNSIKLFLIFVLYTISLSFIGFLIYSICYKLKYKYSILPILLFPLYMPLALLAINTHALDSLLDYFQIWIGLNLILTMMSMWLSYYAFIYSLE